MIPISNIAVEKESNEKENWRTILSRSRISRESLFQRLGLDNNRTSASAADCSEQNAESLFPLVVPEPYLQKIQVGNLNDPLLLQVLPQTKEFLNVNGFIEEPLAEQDFSPVPGLIHKYKSRVLLIATQSCAIHCRYCFRRNFPYSDHRNSQESWQLSLDYIAKHEEINEVILSGGDPLVMSDKALNRLITQVDEIKHIRRIRIHTRLLPALPQRVTNELLDIFKNRRCRLIVVSHCNHAQELGEDVASALARLHSQGIQLLNQSVLLKGVNDDARALATLSESLWELNVQPYYLHLLDKVSGAAHFDIGEQEAHKIYKCLLALLPGFLVPKLVLESPGERSKTPVSL
jgi:EF-P beta-lysylation protein EpmB